MSCADRESVCTRSGTPLPDRIRAGAALLLAAAVVHLALTPQDVTAVPAGLRAAWCAAIAVLAVSIVAAPALASAWRDRPHST